MNLSPHYAFVVQLSAETPLCAKDLSGRVEHVVSAPCDPVRVRSRPLGLHDGCDRTDARARQPVSLRLPPNSDGVGVGNA